VLFRYASTNQSTPFWQLSWALSALLMKKAIIFIALAIPILGFGVAMSYLDHKKPLTQSFNGLVTYIEWRSKNHGMPLIEIKQENGTVKRFHTPRIILKDSQLKVGDRLVKESGSKYCQINSEKVLCLN
jgi:hypothetical protein